MPLNISPTSCNDAETRRFSFKPVTKRGTGGVDHPLTMPADQILDDFQRKSLLLCVTLNSGSKPHELIAFGFHKLLGWKPSVIAEELKNKTLSDLAENLYQEYTSCFQTFPPARSFCVIDDAFCALFLALRMQVVDLYPESQYDGVRRRYPRQVIGASNLGDYLGDSPTDTIVDWSSQVKGRVKKLLAIV